MGFRFEALSTLYLPMSRLLSATIELQSSSRYPEYNTIGPKGGGVTL